MLGIILTIILLIILYLIKKQNSFYKIKKKDLYIYLPDEVLSKVNKDIKKHKKGKRNL